MSPSATDSHLDISAVERDTGISKDTLRVWERRYGYPNPRRNEHGERMFRPEHLHKLRVVRRLLDQGHRPGALVPLPVEELESLAVQTGDPLAESTGEHAQLSEAGSILKTLDAQTIEEFRNELVQSLKRDGIERFVCETVTRLNHLVGRAWVTGSMQIYQEHAYTESLQIVLRNAIYNIATNGESPRVLLATPPNELHGLGLLMAEAMLTVKGCRCLSLGTQMPLNEIVLAQSRFQAQIIGITVSNAMNPNQALKVIGDLREQLDDSVQIWFGGVSDVFKRKIPVNTRYFSNLWEIETALGHWRDAHDISA